MHSPDKSDVSETDSIASNHAKDRVPSHDAVAPPESVTGSGGGL